MSAEKASPARVRVYTRPGCHLCDQAIAVVAAVCGELGETWETVDITSDAARDEGLLERFHDEIPVTFVDGRQHDFWRVDADRLRAALAGGPERRRWWRRRA